MCHINIDSLDNEPFAGCHLFRLCSDAKQCLIPNRSDSNHCIYRKNIESGKIFIGKNANNFNADIYQKWIAIYNSLSPDIKYELNCILSYYQEFRTSVLWYNSPELQKLSELGFISLSREPDIFQKFSMKFLRTLTTSKFNMKEKLINYLINNEPEITKKYVDMFRYVSIPFTDLQYMFELYHDCVENQSEHFIKTLPLKNSSMFVNS